MLKISKITKRYKTGDFVQDALKKISIDFRNNEFVAVLGPSGSGKTTLLNILGGLDRYDSGDLIINDKSTKKFKDTDWDAYRNNCIGFIFQSYNLISHINILENVEMGMTLSGLSQKKRRKKALAVIERVGLTKHRHKKPNQLSGGQMQRVAIARALANDPDIILADEPTGALDSKTSIQIMNLIKEIAQDKLVIMVTHNPDLASEYASRVLELKDGELVNDTNPIKEEEKEQKKYKIKKTAMNFLTALKLSFNNIKTKKGRTLLTAFASSIGIIGIALILSLSNGFDKQIKQFEKDSLSSLPIMISSQSVDMSAEAIKALETADDGLKEYPNEKKIYVQKNSLTNLMHVNNIDEEYVNYIKNIDSDLISAIGFDSAMSLNIVGKVGDSYLPITSIFGAIPQKEELNDETDWAHNNYDIIAGDFPKNKEDLILIVDSKNQVNEMVLKALGLNTEENSEFSFEDIMALELKLVPNDLYYKNYGEIYGINSDFSSLYNSDESITLKITGIARGKEDKKFITSFAAGVGYTRELTDYVVRTNENSAIVNKQKETDYNILNMEKFADETAKEQFITYLGGNDNPYLIQIFSDDFDTKDAVLAYLDAYNEGKSNEDKIIYNDMGEMLASMSGNIMDAVTYVLIGFSSISLIVSTIMICIITYISVLERTKEIGILRALGARKKDVTRVFNAETFIVGVSSGLLGILIARLLLIPANAILYSLTDLKNVAVLNPMHALVLIIISVALTLLGGFIPAKLASKKDPVEALRTE